MTTEQADAILANLQAIVTGLQNVIIVLSFGCGTLTALLMSRGFARSGL